MTLAIGVNEHKAFSNEHFGESHYFLIYQWNGNAFELVEERLNAKFDEEKHGDERKAQHIMSQLSDVSVLVAKVFGPNIKKVKQRYVIVISRIDDVQQTVAILNNKYEQLMKAVQSEGEKEIIYLDK